MAQPAELTQLWMDIRLEEGKFVLVPVKDDDIGGELLPILSKGLYTYPLHCVREYVQNAVDASATQVQIKITGNSVIISDNGKGMSLAELVQARQFGVSTKDVRQNVGFRGIGVYSGYDLCNRLLITTKKAEERYAYVLEFDFGAMKKQLASDAKAKTRRTSLAALLEMHSRFTKEPEDEGIHYTVVQLEDISDVHIKQLEDRAELRKYMLRNLPIDFDDDFKYRNAIDTMLRKEVPGYNAVKVILESDGAPREVVVKPTIPHLSEPFMAPILNSKGEKIAFYWACLRKPSLDENGKPVAPRGRIPDNYADYRGFVYKVKRFTIGDNTKLQGVFKQGNSGLYWWYTGEVYVIDPEVVPNTARDDFETSPAQRQLESRVHDALRKLEKTASEYQEESRALEKFLDRDSDLVRLENAFNDNTYNQLMVYSELDDIIRELKAQKAKLPDDQKQWGQDTLSRAEKLKRQVQGEIDNPQPAPTKRRRMAKHGKSTDKTQTDTVQKRQETSELPPIKRLAELIETAGWAVTEDCARLIDLIDRSLADVLVSGSSTHRAVLSDIEANLSTEMAE